ncbi:hypothetical protein HQQ88_14270 [Curtobacterium sp. VKM Ac-2861]|uniref:hypothetical protein n=1 Tax=unclassified Curtobacterium TaxID=257496 RepID=UPI001564B093|nr:hypothetical protein [Curtobacterium sp. MWU13-2055]NQW91456.1 hypothetical protein [Curtobacterium sp. VKM Ac-2861]
MTTTTTSVRRPRAFIAVAAAALLLPALLTACSGTPKDDATTAAGGKDKAVSLAACMREKGYDMPDPAGADTTSSVGVPEGVDPDQWQSDLAACAKGSGTAGDAVGSAESIPGGAEAARKAAKCIREHGFADYPDDDQSAYEPSDPDAFAEVAQECERTAFDGLGAEAGK